MKRIGSILVGVSWLLYLASWTMPAVRFQDAEPYMGWMAGQAVIHTIPSFYRDWSSFLGSILGIGNIFAVIAPAALFFSAKRLFGFLSLFSIAVFVIALSMSFFGKGYAEGYYFWVASFLGTAIGFGTLSVGVPPAESPKPTGFARG